MEVIHVTTDYKYRRVRIPAEDAQSFDKAVRPMLGRKDAVPAPVYMTASWNEVDEAVGKRVVVMVVDDAPKADASNKNMLASKLLSASGGNRFLQLYGNVVMVARAKGLYCGLSCKQLKTIENELLSLL